MNRQESSNCFKEAWVKSDIEEPLLIVFGLAFTPTFWCLHGVAGAIRDHKKIIELNTIEYIISIILFIMVAGFSTIVFIAIIAPAVVPSIVVYFYNLIKIIKNQ